MAPALLTSTWEADSYSAFLRTVVYLSGAEILHSQEHKRTISMLSRDKSFPTPSGISTHHLRGKALRQWWQLDQFFRIKGAQKVYPNQNPAIQCLIHFLFVVPIFVVMALLSHKLGIEHLRLHILTGAAYLGACLLFISCIRRHLRHVLNVEATETGLKLSSLFFKRRINWLDIVDFYPTGNAEFGHNEYVVDCRNGEQFFLSKDLSESSKLFELTASRVSVPQATYETCYYVADGFFDMPLVACFSIFVALLFTAVPHNATPTFNEIIATAGVPLLLSTLPIYCWWLNLNRVPQLLRAGQSELYVRTRNGKLSIPWSRISKITKIGPWMIVKSSLGWFVMLAPKEEPIVVRLLACKQNLLTKKIRP